jgi:DNA repair protein RadA/Sms
MARGRSRYVCQNCGAVSHRWQGRCESCEEWNSVVEEADSAGPRRSGLVAGPVRGRIIDLVALEGAGVETPRSPSGVAEFDRVTGGGFVAGSALLVGGAPGIGKSTLLLQVCAAMARRGRRTVYISGEESVEQIRMRAGRLALTGAAVELAAETCVEDILASLAAGPRPDLLVLDSIQTLWTGAIDSAPGTVAQVRAASQAMIAFAKKTGAAVCLVGHVTKDGQIAGPKTVEHMVDAVLSFEGEGGQLFRVVRAQKNRFGPTDEIGVFEMTGAGLAEVANPSELFLSERNPTTPGVAVFAGMEGSRPVLCEIQALVAPSLLGTPRRAVVGWDGPRLAMVLAVLEARCGVRLGASDVYLNVAGGLRIVEPAADLAVAAALISALTGRPLDADGVFFGEISLSGAVRAVGQDSARTREAERLGFTHATVPKGASAGGSQSIRLERIGDLAALVAGVAGRPAGAASTLTEETDLAAATAA